MTTEIKYWAFLSYSSKNRRAAAKLHRRLESFSIPEKFRGKVLQGLVAKTHLRPVFRDRDELASSGNLTDNIIKALSQSTSLIVLCSPEAAKSPWVNMEIEQFIHLHGPDRVFPLILNGIPGSGDEYECFPPALRSEKLDPIAGDLRKEGDGSRAGLLKIISGILQVPFDELRGREAQQRQRRLATVLAITAAIALSTTFLAVYALQQRDAAHQQQQIAEQRRAQAEDLIGFMLGDLRERLQSVGRLDVLDSVGNKVKGYFEELPVSELTDQTLASQAMALRQIGEIRLQQGNYDEAKAAFKSSLDQSQELHQRHPGNTKYLFDLSQAQFWQGYSHYLAQEYYDAELLYLGYLESAKAMVLLEPDNTEFLIELAYAYSNLGTVALDLHEKQKSLQAFQNSRALFADMHKLNPDDLDIRFELATTDGWLARVYSSTYELKSALDYRLTAVNELGDIAEISDHPFHRRIHAEELGLLSHLYFQLGEIPKAVQVNSKATQLFRQLSLHDEQNVEWQLRYLFYQHLSSWLDYFVLESPSVLADLRENQQAYEILSSTDPENGEWQKILAKMKTNNATVALLCQDSNFAEQFMGKPETGFGNNGSDGNSKTTSAKVAQLLEEGFIRAVLMQIKGDRQTALNKARQIIDETRTLALTSDQHLETLALLHRFTGNTARVSEDEKLLQSGGFNSPRYHGLVNLLSTVSIENNKNQ